jgi:hypothetical protein
MATEPPSKAPEDNVIESQIALTPEVDKFWIDYGHKMLSTTLGDMDERAKYMITTCASLIVIHFGLLLAFKVQGASFKIAPEFFFVVAAAIFVLSYFPTRIDIDLQSPASIRFAHKLWFTRKLKCHRYGFILFIIGLLAMASSIIVPQAPI